MQMSPIGKMALIAREGRRLMAYTDSVGVLTIGIGCTTIYGRPVQRGDIITAVECDVLFESTLSRYDRAVSAALKVDVPQHAHDALVSVCYNIGIGTPNPKPGQSPGMAGSSFIKRINAGDMQGARDAILMWKKPAAIIGRRQAEAEQFVTPYAVRMPRATAGSKPIAAPTPLPVTPGIRPVPVEPIIVPPIMVPRVDTWWGRFGSWVDRTFGDGHQEVRS